MKYESVKSILLSILVATSAILTWSLWTYQPKYPVIDKKYMNMHEVSIAKQVDTADLIKPNKVLFHVNGLHYGTDDDNEISQLINEMSKWNFYDFSSEVISSRKSIENLSHSDNRVEIVFPDLVPLDVYKGIIHLETESFPRTDFDRIVINLANESIEGASSVYFIDTDGGKVNESHVNPERIASLLEEINRNKRKYDKYSAFELKGDRTLFLPTEEVELEKSQYYTDYIDPVKFKNALFRDPSKVRRDILQNGEKFTDDSSLMNVDYSTSTIFYANPGHIQAASLEITDNQVVKKSINFVNEHGGWTDNYRYFSKGKYEQMTIFRLFLNGYPVFNEQGMAEIRQNWGTDEIYEYKRPYFSLDFAVPGGKTKVILPSGEWALNYLLEDDDFNSELLEDLSIGYRLSKDTNNSKVLVLEPSWYYLYAGSWLRLDPEFLGGDILGLE